MYTLTRQDAAEILGISTRSVDRYIKWWKIRAKKEWKLVLLNKEDIDILAGNVVSNKKLIIKEKSLWEWIDMIKVEWNHDIVRKSDYEKIISTFEKMYAGFREEVRQKDEKIQELSLELWKVREQKNNSIDILEYKKMKFINEENNKKIKEKLDLERKKLEEIWKNLKYEKTTNKLLILFLIVLFIVSWMIFFNQL